MPQYKVDLIYDAPEFEGKHFASVSEWHNTLDEACAFAQEFNFRNGNFFL